MKFTGDLTSKRLIYFKGFLFLLTGAVGAGLLLLAHPDVRTALLLVITIWSFCRFYYFLFYVIEKYVDPKYRFSGIYSFIQYLLKRPIDRQIDDENGIARPPANH